MPLRTIYSDQSVINSIYKKEVIHLKTDENIGINEVVILRSNIDEKHTAMAIHKGNGKFFKLAQPLYKPSIEPLDSEQKALMSVLVDPDIKVITVEGPAGSGKSLLACAYAIDELQWNKTNVVITKPMVGVGHEYEKAYQGTITGDEKHAPFMGSYITNFKKLGLDEHYLEASKKKGVIKFYPIAFMRGETFDNTTLIFDEAQSMDWHVMKTIVSRMGQDSKIIIMGDLDQRDTHIEDRNSGLFKLIHSKTFKSSKLTTSIKLTNVHRGPIAELVHRIDKE